MTASKQQIGGSHYRDFAIQPSEFIHKNGIGFLVGNVIKYVCRYKAKNGRQDLEKARHYIDLLLEWEYPDAPRSEPADRVVDVPDVPECGLYRDRPGACASCEEE
jgi:hypothetical protein